jgi:hypothetical protein
MERCDDRPIRVGPSLRWWWAVKLALATTSALADSNKLANSI